MWPFLHLHQYNWQPQGQNGISKHPFHIATKVMTQFGNLCTFGPSVVRSCWSQPKWHFGKVSCDHFCTTNVSTEDHRDKMAFQNTHFTLQQRSWLNYTISALLVLVLSEAVEVNPNLTLAKFHVTISAPPMFQLRTTGTKWHFKTHISHCNKGHDSITQSLHFWS